VLLESKIYVKLRVCVQTDKDHFEILPLTREDHIHYLQRTQVSNLRVYKANG
jgi:hypothetical protein